MDELLAILKPDSDQAIIYSNQLFYRSFPEVESIEKDLQELGFLCDEIRFTYQNGKTSFYNAKIVNELRSINIPAFLNKAKLIMLRQEDLVKQAGNDVVEEQMKKLLHDEVDELQKKLVEVMDRFYTLRNEMESDDRETLQRRYYIVTGEYPKEKVLDSLMKTVDSETFLKKVIQQQGRGHIMDTITEIQERHDTVNEIKNELIELQQVYRQLAEFVEIRQGKLMGNIEMNVNDMSSMVSKGTHQWQTSVPKKYHKRNKRWFCLGG